MIQPIVEGHGEVEAVPVLLRRLLADAGIFEQIAPSIRKRRSDFNDKTKVKKAVRLAMIQPECEAILIIFDADDDCPKNFAEKVSGWAREEAGLLPCEVVIPNREFEAWFLGGLSGLAGHRSIYANAEDQRDPERWRDAKGKLEEFMENSAYSETLHQPGFSDQFSFKGAFQNSRSFRRMCHALETMFETLGKRVTFTFT
jgi:hypothetical protein